MLAKRHRYGKWLAGFHRFFVMNFAVLSWRDIQTDLVLVLKHHSITADVLHTGFGISSHNEVSRSKIAPTVAFVPTRNGKSHEIYFLSSLNIFENGTGRNNVGLHRLHGTQLSPKSIDQRYGFQFQRQVKRQCGALQTFEHVNE